MVLDEASARRLIDDKANLADALKLGFSLNFRASARSCFIGTGSRIFRIAVTASIIFCSTTRELLASHRFGLTRGMHTAGRC